MINIRLVSDLRNKYPKIEELALKEDNDKEYEDYIENALDEADKEAENLNTRYYSHEEFKKIARRTLDSESLNY